MNRRDEIYCQILSTAILRIRTFGWSEHAELCAIEADHVHNIPSLIGESNEALHAYYLKAERVGYLSRVANPDASYAELWAELEAIGMKASPS